MIAPSMHATFTIIKYACLDFIKIIVLAPSSVYLSTTATYLSSCSFMYLCVPCYCHVCLSLLRYAWKWKLYTIQSTVWKICKLFWKICFEGTNTFFERKAVLTPQFFCPYACACGVVIYVKNETPDLVSWAA